VSLGYAKKGLGLPQTIFGFLSSAGEVVFGTWEKEKWRGDDSYDMSELASVVAKEKTPKSIDLGAEMGECSKNLLTNLTKVMKVMKDLTRKSSCYSSHSFLLRGFGVFGLTFIKREEKGALSLGHDFIEVTTL